MEERETNILQMEQEEDQHWAEALEIIFKRIKTQEEARDIMLSFQAMTKTLLMVHPPSAALFNHATKQFLVELVRRELLPLQRI